MALPEKASKSQSEKRMQILVNGAEQDLPTGANILALLKQLDIAPERIAIEINLTVIDRAAYHERIFQEGDKVEIISFIGGGQHVG